MWKAVALIVLSLTLGAYLLSTPPLGQVKEKGIKELVKDKSAKERANIKGDEIVKKAKTQTYVSGDFTIEIQSVEKIEDGVQVFARAWKNGQPVGFGSDGSVEIERFKIYNPPVMVPDGTCTPMVEMLGSKEIETCQPNYREAPAEALRQALAHTISVSSKSGENIVAGKVGNTTSTFYPDANPESTSVDGYLQRDATVSWADTRDGTNATEASTDSASMFFTQGEKVGSNWINTRNVMLFDTSAIPDTDSVSSATLSIYRAAVGVEDDTGGVSSNIVSSNPSSSTNLVVGDYDVADFGSTELSTRKTQSDFTTNAYSDFVLNASGRANISTTGVSKFAERNSKDLDNVEPTVRSYMQVSAADTTGTTNDPKLVVVHAAAAAPSVGTFFWGEQ